MDEKKINDNNEEVDIFTLTDEDGNEIEFELVAQCDRNGNKYFAMIPVEEDNKDDDVCEYVILKLAIDKGEEVLVTVDDDEELDDVAEYFDALFASEIDYD